MRDAVRAAAALACLLAAPAAMAAGVEVPNPLGGAQKPPPPRTSLAKPPAPAAVPAAAGAGAVFPKAVDPRYASESAGKARMHTCLDQYKANTGSGNGGLKWIEKGGGYYSVCNSRLKG